MIQKNIHCLLAVSTIITATITTGTRMLKLWTNYCNKIMLAVTVAVVVFVIQNQLQTMNYTTNKTITDYLN